MKLDMIGVGLFFGISECRLETGTYRVCCQLCGVKGNEREPKIGKDSTLKEVRKEARNHTAWHLEKAVEEHRERLLKIE